MEKIQRALAPYYQQWRKMMMPLIFAIWLYLLMTILSEYGGSSPSQSIPGVRSTKNTANFLVKPKLSFFSMQSSSSDEITEVPLTFLHMKYPDEPKYVIVMLVTNTTKDVDNLCVALQSLSFFHGDIPGFRAPVLVFNEGNLNPHQLQNILRSTSGRAVAFPTVDFDEFPPGFDPYYEKPEFVVEGRSKWGYYQMIRFWITGIWKHPAIEPFDIMVRIDSDSCFREPNDHLPRFKVPSVIYHSQYVGNAGNTKYVEGLYDFAKDFLKNKDNMPPTNTLMWQMVENAWIKSSSLPVFMTNFEMVRKRFMHHPDVMEWHEALTEREPFGVYRHRWSDSVVRFLSAAMFIQNENVMTSQPYGYHHRTECQ